MMRKDKKLTRDRKYFHHRVTQIKVERSSFPSLELANIIELVAPVVTRMWKMGSFIDSGKMS